MMRYDNRQLLCDKCGKLSSNIYSYRVIEQETNEMTSGRTLLSLIRQILVCIWIIYLLLTLYALCYPVTLHMNSTKTNCYFSLKCVCITWPPHVDSLIRVAINSRSFVSVSLSVFFSSLFQFHDINCCLHCTCVLFFAIFM